MQAPYNYFLFIGFGDGKICFYANNNNKSITTEEEKPKTYSKINNNFGGSVESEAIEFEHDIYITSIGNTPVSLTFVNNQVCLLYIYWRYYFNNLYKIVIHVYLHKHIVHLLW